MKVASLLIENGFRSLTPFTAFSTQACVQVMLCSRLHFHVQIVNDGFDTSMTNEMGPIGAAMEMKNIDRCHRGGERSEIRFAEGGATTTGQSV